MGQEQARYRQGNSEAITVEGSTIIHGQVISTTTDSGLNAEQVLPIWDTRNPRAGRNKGEQPGVGQCTEGRLEKEITCTDDCRLIAQVTNIIRGIDGYQTKRGGSEEEPPTRQYLPYMEEGENMQSERNNRFLEREGENERGKSPGKRIELLQTKAAMREEICPPLGKPITAPFVPRLGRGGPPRGMPPLGPLAGERGSYLQAATRGNMKHRREETMGRVSNEGAEGKNRKGTNQSTKTYHPLEKSKQGYDKNLPKRKHSRKGSSKYCQLLERDKGESAGTER